MARSGSPSGTRTPAKRPAGAPARSPFAEVVAGIIRSIPAGQTLSYGGVARRAGKPHGARAVVQALRLLDDVPWWRVIRSDGTLAPEVAAKQAPLLRAEGVPVEGRRVRRSSR